MKIIASIFSFLLLTSLSLQAQKAPIGVWNTGSDNSQVEITEAEGNYVGTLIASDNPKAKIGKALLKDFKAVGKKWKCQLYAPKRGEWLDAKLEEKGDKLLITVGSGFMTKTLEWTKESE